MEDTRTISEYLNAAASSSPTPGGGSVCAIVGALSASMGEMACNFTLGKKKYASVEADVQKICDELSTAQKRFVELATLDEQAYDAYRKAVALPKDDQARTDEITSATQKALAVPREILSVASSVVKLANELADKSNPCLISDVGVCVIMASAAAQGALLNVKINLKALGIEDNSALAEVEKVKILAEETVDAVLSIMQ